MKLELALQLEALCKSLGVRFIYKKRPISFQEVFSPSGFLPGLVKRADQLCSLCFGYGLGATFEDAEHAKLGQRVRFDEVTPVVLRIMCLVDVIFELRKGSKNKAVVPLDELNYD